MSIVTLLVLRVARLIPSALTTYLQRVLQEYPETWIGKPARAISASQVFSHTNNLSTAEPNVWYTWTGVLHYPASFGSADVTIGVAAETCGYKGNITLDNFVVAPK